IRGCATPFISVVRMDGTDHHEAVNSGFFSCCDGLGSSVEVNEHRFVGTGVSTRTRGEDDGITSLCSRGNILHRPFQVYPSSLHTLFFESIHLFFRPYHRPNTDRKSTRLNSSHVSNSYAVFCLKQKK